MTDETPHIPETLAQYLTENQDPQQVARIYDCLLYTSPSPRDS